MYSYILITNYFVIFPIFFNVLLFFSFLLFLLSYTGVDSYFNKSIRVSFKLGFMYSFLLASVLLFIKIYLILSLRTIGSALAWYAYSGLYVNIGIMRASIVLPLFADIILLLAIFLSLLCWVLLSERSLLDNYFNLAYFLVFILLTVNMVYSVNLYHMFLFFELIFLPSLYFVYTTGYSKKVDKAIFYLLLWTYSGSFVVLLGLCYLYVTYQTGNIAVLAQQSFSIFERSFLFWIFFLGFGVKVPVWPFHYWLTKVHVEAPAGFSIFLSGFLVKTALYCLYFFIFLFIGPITRILSGVIIFWGFMDASFRMWGVQDLKKLIAFATIQEMNLILFFLVFGSNHLLITMNLFIAVHGLLSGLLFFLVDQVQKRTQTRNLAYLGGLGAHLTILPFFIWTALLIFRGFPIFIKFFIEWELVLIIFESFYIVGVVIFLVSSLVGVLGFVRAWFIVLYGQPKLKAANYTDMNKKDIYIAASLVLVLMYLNFCLVLF